MIPLAELGRPRIDVTVRISGLLPRRVPAPRAPPRRRRGRRRRARRVRRRQPRRRPRARRRRAAGRRARAQPAWRRATTRVFGSKPGTYGAGLLQLVDSRDWRDDGDLAAVYEAWGGYAYGRGLGGTPASEAMRDAYARIEVAVKNVDSREHDILDSDDYYQYHGGMVATVARHPRERARRLPRRLLGPLAGGRADAGRGDAPRVPRSGGEPALDRVDDPPRLQGRGRAVGDGRLPVRLRRDGGRRRGLDVRAGRRALPPRPRRRRVHGRVEPVGGARRSPSGCSRPPTAACGRSPPTARSTRSATATWRWRASSRRRRREPPPSR